MNCVRCEELMSDYLEGTISQAQRIEIDQHLKTCGDCSELLRGMTEVMQWGKAFPVYEVPQRLHARIIANSRVLTCAQCEQLVSEYLEATLAESDRSAMDTHL